MPKTDPLVNWKYTKKTIDKAFFQFAIFPGDEGLPASGWSSAVSKTRRLPERSEKTGSPLNSGAKCGKHCSREQRKDEKLCRWLNCYEWS